MTTYRRRSRNPGLPPLLEAWNAGDPPPADYQPTDVEREQVRDAVMFGDADVGGTLVPMRKWRDHPHRGEWLRWLDKHVQR